MTERWTETEIAAFLDGELDEERAARVAAALESDPAAADVARRLQDNDRLLREAFAAPLAEPVPAAIATALAAPAGRVVPFPGRPRRVSGWMPAALAASVALTVSLAGGALLRSGNGTPVMAVGPAADSLAAVLETEPSGVALNRVRPLASFLVDGGVCREFEVLGAEAAPTSQGLACRAGSGWSVILATAVEPARADPAGGGFAPADGMASDAIGPLLESLGAGPALDPAAERAAIAAGWAD
jgi:hypothetical protein